MWYREKDRETATLLNPFTLKISLVILLTVCYYNCLKVSLESFELGELIITSLIKFLYSHYLPVEIAFEIVRRNSVLVTHRSWRVKRSIDLCAKVCKSWKYSSEKFCTLNRQLSSTCVQQCIFDVFVITLNSWLMKI